MISVDFGASALLLRKLSAIIVTPPATPTIPITSPTLAMVCCVLPLFTSSVRPMHGLMDGIHLLSRSEYVDLLIAPATPNMTNPTTPTPASAPPAIRSGGVLLFGFVSPPPGSVLSPLPAPPAPAPAPAPPPPASVLAPE